MNKIEIEKKYILEYIKDILQSLKQGSQIITNAKYHHNSSYSSGASICKNGILSISDLHKLDVRKFDRELLQKLSDAESHVNGIDEISLSVVDLTDLYRSEDILYNPLLPQHLDFLISSDIQVRRAPDNYGNEFLSSKSISPESLRSLDIRMLKLIETVSESDCNSIEKLIEQYNNLRLIASTIREINLDLPIREMSNEDNKTLDIDKLSTMPRLILKK